MKYELLSSSRISTALLLAAGTGSRLFPLTKSEPKCLTLVNGISILQRLIVNLETQGIRRLVIVTGYLEQHIRQYLGEKVGNIHIEYIFNPIFKTTNNIYSLWLARNIIKESFLLLESDLVFDVQLLDNMMLPNKIAIAKKISWMDGSCVSLDQFRQVEQLMINDEFPKDQIIYKTVNMYSLSLTSWRQVTKRLNRFINKGKVHQYYETVFAELIAEGKLSFEGVKFDNTQWYEIDTVSDLAKAEKLFEQSHLRPLRPLQTLVAASSLGNAYEHAAVESSLGGLHVIK